MEQGEIILYQPDEAVKLEVRLEDETVWLTQAQIVDLFQSSKANISEHIKNIYDQKELEESSTVRDFRTSSTGRQTASDAQSDLLQFGCDHIHWVSCQ